MTSSVETSTILDVESPRSIVKGDSTPPFAGSVDMSGTHFDVMVVFGNGPICVMPICSQVRVKSTTPSIADLVISMQMLRCQNESKLSKKLERPLRQYVIWRRQRGATDAIRNQVSTRRTPIS